MFFVGIDLAWSNSNLTAVSILKGSKKPKIITHSLLKSNKDIVNFIIEEVKDEKVFIGVDAPLRVLNFDGNRETEKEILRDFAKFKLGVHAVNRKLFLNRFKVIRGEELVKEFTKFDILFKKDSQKQIFEVYPHSIILTLFNNYKVLKYKRKKGRTTHFIKSELIKLQKFLKEVVESSDIFDIDINTLKSKELKSYEDILDSLVCAYMAYFYYTFPNKCKFYGNEEIGYMVNPKIKIEKEY